MASQMMEKHDISPFPYGTGNLERFTAAWKMDTFRNSFGTKIERTPCRMFTASSSLKKPIPVDSQAPNYLDIPDQIVSFSFQKHVLEEERSFDPSLNLWDVTNFDAGMDAHLSRDRTSGTSSFSRDDLCLSSLSEFLDKKLQLSSNDVESVTSHYKEEPFDSREEIEAQTIGDLLPKDNDLLSGLVDGLINIAQPSLEDGIEDLDVFSSVAGMDLIDGTMSVGNTGCLHTGTSVSLAGENPYHERLSRTLLVRSVDNNVEDFELQALFEQYGDIHRLFTGNKHRGFVMVSYFDIRAARNALQALQNKPLRCRRLDIHYSIPKGNPLEKDINQGTLVIYNLDYAVSNDYLLRIFGIFGDIKEIHERSDQKYIEFYDVRAANKALLALNHNDIAGKPITVESSYCGGIRHSWNDTMHASVDSFPWERADNTHLGTSRSCDEIANGFGKAENGKGNFHRHHRMSSNSKHFGSTPTSIWPSLPLFCSDFSHLHGLSRSPANSTLPINGHHVGPTPAVAPSLWNRLSSSYERVSLEGSRFHQGPRGRIHGSRQHHHRVTSNMFPCVDGYCMEIPIKGEHAKSRKNESSSGQVDNKKQYKLDIDKIRRGEDGRTTLMIKNIPNKYTSKLLMAAIDECHRGTYDFIYLPIDFKNKCNVGYAFINMVDPSHIIPVYKTLNGKRWEKFNSEKVASLAYARIQGKAALIAHFQNSSLMNEDKRCRPILFHSDGLNVGDQVPFPMGANIRSRPGRSRSSNIEGNHQES